MRGDGNIEDAESSPDGDDDLVLLVEQERHAVWIAVEAADAF